MNNSFGIINLARPHYCCCRFFNFLFLSSFRGGIHYFVSLRLGLSFKCSFIYFYFLKRPTGEVSQVVLLSPSQSSFCLPNHLVLFGYQNVLMGHPCKTVFLKKKQKNSSIAVWMGCVRLPFFLYW